MSDEILLLPGSAKKIIESYKQFFEGKEPIDLLKVEDEVNKRVKEFEVEQRKALVYAQADLIIDLMTSEFSKKGQSMPPRDKLHDVLAMNLITENALQVMAFEEVANDYDSVYGTEFLQEISERGLSPTQRVYALILEGFRNGVRAKDEKMQSRMVSEIGTRMIILRHEIEEDLSKELVDLEEMGV
ncbi:MAG: hypothetical protein JXA43_02805 [Candidatus Diapherotrites archaeon]|nr:hypothetical protein [Candidatus Diapherotrites archaeon]